MAAARSYARGRRRDVVCAEPAYASGIADYVRCSVACGICSPPAVRATGAKVASSSDFRLEWVREREVGKNVQIGLHCGGKWDSFAASEPGWRGSSHPSTPVSATAQEPTMVLPWHLRPHARREEPPYGSRALSRDAGGGRGDGDAGRPEAVRRGVAPGASTSATPSARSRSCRRSRRGSPSSSASSTAAPRTPSSTPPGGSCCPASLASTPG